MRKRALPSSMSSTSTKSGWAWSSRGWASWVGGRRLTYSSLGMVSGVLALVRKRGEETLVGLFNFTEYPAGAGLDALGGEYHTPEGTSVWLADVELEPYQALLVRC